MSKEIFPPAGTPLSCVIASVCDAAGWQAVVAAGEALPCHAVELRLDLLPEGFGPGPCTRPLLLTLRHPSEGGGRAMDEDARRARARALLSHAAALDWEIARMEGAGSLLAAARKAGVSIVASAHDFDKTPPLERMLAQEAHARALGADIVKFAFRLNCEADMLVGVELLRRASGPMAVMGMGALGPVSRLLYAQYGSCLTYGYLGDAPTAPGQWPAGLFTEALSCLETAPRDASCC